MSGLYVHIPFCVKKCGYCDFLSFADGRRELENEYIDALISELKTHRGKRVETVYIGGGTPSVLTHTNLERLIAVICELWGNETEEFSVEVNPGTLDEKKCDILRKGGVNRISIGLQSADDDELLRLGRIHDTEAFEKIFSLVREAGFQNVNIDLIMSVPGSELFSWERTLRYAAEKKPEHISAYSLIIEESTLFYERYNGGESPELFDEETDRRAYCMTKDILSACGYERYEISNFAKPGFYCRHNVTYWECGDYIGCGLGASGFEDKERYRNTTDIYRYINDPGLGRERVSLTKKEMLQECFFMGLRMERGINLKNLDHRFGIDAEVLFSDVINRLKEEDLVVISEGHLSLSERGFDLENRVDSAFYDACDERVMG